MRRLSQRIQDFVTMWELKEVPHRESLECKSGYYEEAGEIQEVIHESPLVKEDGCNAVVETSRKIILTVISKAPLFYEMQHSTNTHWISLHFQEHRDSAVNIAGKVPALPEFIFWFLEDKMESN